MKIKLGTLSAFFTLGLASQATFADMSLYTCVGLGHRTKIVFSDGSTRLQIYSPESQLLYATQSAVGSKPATSTSTSTNYNYLHHGLIAEQAQ